MILNKRTDMKYYIGVDGGGTKTACVLFDENRQAVSEYKAPGSNHENLDGSYDEAADIIAGGVRALLSQAGVDMDSVCGMFMGLAGVDSPAQHDILFKKLSERGLERYDICNDGFLGLMAGIPDCVGVCYNCGTGTVSVSIGEDGRQLQLGGFGELSGDSGNGEWISQRAFCAVYDQLLLGGERTLITDIVTKTEPDIMNIISGLDSEDSDRWRRVMTDAFYEALNAGDEAAYKIMSHMAERGAMLIAAHIRAQKFGGDEVKVVLSGSMHTKMPNGIYIKELERNIHERTGKRVRLIKLDVPPVYGCLNRLLRTEDR